MPATDPFAPIWAGTTAATERVGSPKWSYNVHGIQVDRVYDGKFSTLLAAAPSIGSFMSDTGLLQISKVTITPDAGGLGVMTIELKLDAFNSNIAPPPVYETEWLEVQKDITKHPRYQPGGVDAIPVTDDMDNWDYIAQARQGNVNSINYLEGLDATDPALKLWTKIKRGEEDYVEYIPIITETVTQYYPPLDENAGAGFIDTPPDAANAPGGWQWLRTAAPTVREGSKWKIKRQWTGAWYIDTDLYPSAAGVAE